jgi:uncharacterized protein
MPVIPSSRSSHARGVDRIGVFAGEFIPKGTGTWRFNPEFDLIITEQIEATLSPSARAQMRKYAYTDLKSGLKILCSDDARFYNQSDEPNTGIDPRINDTMVDYAYRDIECGEEITSDYRTFDIDSARELAFEHEPGE